MMLALFCALALWVPAEWSRADLVLVEAAPGTRIESGVSITSGPKTRLDPAFQPADSELARRLGLDRWYVAEGAPANVLESRYRRARNVRRVLRSSPVRLARVPNDPGFAQQWGLRNTGSPSGTPGSDIDAVTAWDQTTGSASVTIAVIDTGVDADHPDLAGRLLPGYNFVDRNTNTDDFQGHGTNCAGVLGAVGNNGLHVSGVCWDCRILPVKVVGIDGNGNAYGKDLWLAQGIVWAADNGANVLSISLVSDVDAPVTRAAVDYAIARGCTLVAAMGNDSREVVLYPAGYPSVIAVGASDQWDRRASFSNWGSHIDVVAPGTQIATLTNTGGMWQFFGGTSAATPFVSGICALVLSLDPTVTPERMQEVIRQGAEDIVPYGFDAYTGTGRANARNTLAALSDASPPTQPSVTDQGDYSADPGALSFTWTSSSDPQSGVTGYEYAIGTTSNPTAVRSWSQAGAGNSYTATGLSLTPNQSYIISVRAINGSGARGAPGVSDGIIYAPFVSLIGTAFSHSNGDCVTLDNRVATACFPERTWIADAPFGAAIAVTPPIPCAPGDRIRVSGRLATVGGVRTITQAQASILSAGAEPPALRIRQKWLGGTSVNAETPGVSCGSGPYNIGRLAVLRGRVRSATDSTFHVDDGSGLTVCCGQYGVLVRCDGLQPAPIGSLVEVKGIVEPEIRDGLTLPSLRVRAQQDIVLNPD